MSISNEGICHSKGYCALNFQFSVTIDLISIPLLLFQRDWINSYGWKRGSNGELKICNRVWGSQIVQTTKTKLLLPHMNWYVSTSQAFAQYSLLGVVPSTGISQINFHINLFFLVHPCNEESASTCWWWQWLENWKSTKGQRYRTEHSYLKKRKPIH